jgi:hypothetical protein
VADFDLGSVPWAVEAAARDLYERQNDVGAYDDGMIVPEWGDPFYAETWEAHREKAPKPPCASAGRRRSGTGSGTSTTNASTGLRRLGSPRSCRREAHARTRNVAAATSSRLTRA